MITTIAIMVWLTLSIYTIVNLSAMMSVCKIYVAPPEVEGRIIKDWMFFTLPSTFLIGIVGCCPILHMMIATVLAFGDKVRFMNRVCQTMQVQVDKMRREIDEEDML